MKAMVRRVAGARAPRGLAGDDEAVSLPAASATEAPDDEEDGDAVGPAEKGPIHGSKLFFEVCVGCGARPNKDYNKNNNNAF